MRCRTDLDDGAEAALEAGIDGIGVLHIPRVTTNKHQNIKTEIKYKYIRCPNCRSVIGCGFDSPSIKIIRNYSTGFTVRYKTSGVYRDAVPSSVTVLPGNPPFTIEQKNIICFKKNFLLRRNKTFFGLVYYKNIFKNL